MVTTKSRVSPKYLPEAFLLLRRANRGGRRCPIVELAQGAAPGASLPAPTQKPEVLAGSETVPPSARVTTPAAARHAPAMALSRSGLCRAVGPAMPSAAVRAPPAA